jgi:hypothetical protein
VTHPADSPRCHLHVRTAIAASRRLQTCNPELGEQATLGRTRQIFGKDHALERRTSKRQGVQFVHGGKDLGQAEAAQAEVMQVVY